MCVSVASFISSYKKNHSSYLNGTDFLDAINSLDIQKKWGDMNTVR